MEGLSGLRSLKDVVLLKGLGGKDIGFSEILLRALSNTLVDYSRVVIGDLPGHVRLLQ